MWRDFERDLNTYRLGNNIEEVVKCCCCVYKRKSRQVLVGGSLEGKGPSKRETHECQPERESRPGRVLCWLGGAAQLSSQRRSSCFVFRCLDFERARLQWFGQRERNCFDRAGVNM